MVKISYNFLDVKVSGFVKSKSTSWLKGVLDYFGVENANLTYVFVTDSYLLEMNKQHLKHDYYTDIITFNYNEKNSLYGEMYISVDRVRDNADVFGSGDFNAELRRVMAHGVLHLLGHDDHTAVQKKKMRELEEICLGL